MFNKAGEDLRDQVREIFLSGDAQVCLSSVCEIAEAVAGVPRSPPLSASHKQTAAAVSGMLLSQVTSCIRQPIKGKAKLTSHIQKLGKCFNWHELLLEGL